MIRIVGAGAFGREVAASLSDVGEEYTFLDDHVAIGTQIAASKVTGLVNPMFTSIKDDQVIIAVQDPDARHLCRETMKACRFIGGRHETVKLSQGCRVGIGCLLMQWVFVGVDTEIGEFSIANVGTSIGHDCKIGNFVTIAGDATLCGGVTVGDYAFIGAGARIAPGVTIGAGAAVGIGSVVISDVPDGSNMFGNPARKM